MLIPLLSIGACVLAIVSAVKGKGYRGLYFALMVGAIVASFLFIALIPNAAQIQAADESLRSGYAVMTETFPALSTGCWYVAIGCLIAGLAFRARPPLTPAR